MVLAMLLTLLMLAILVVVSGSSVCVCVYIYIYIYWIDGFLFWDNKAKLLDIVVASLLVGYRYKLFLKNYLIIE